MTSTAHRPNQQLPDQRNKLE